MTVVESVRRDIEAVGDVPAAAGLVATALALAAQIDDGRRVPECAKALADVWREIREMAPAKPEETELERRRRNRFARLEGLSAPPAASSS